MYEDLSFYMKDKVSILVFQIFIFYHLDAKDRNEEARKLKYFIKLAKGEKVVLVTSAEAILKKYIPKEVLLDNTTYL